MKEPRIAFTDLNEESEKLGPNAYFLNLQRTNQLPRIIANYPRFCEKLFSFEGLRLLAVTSFYIHIWAHDVSLEKQDDYVLEVADGEALQALLLTKDYDKTKPLPTPEDFPSIWEELRAQHFAIIGDEDEASLSPSQKSLVKRLRLHSAYYRNPYGRRFAEKMMLDITSEIDKRWNRTQSFAFFQFLFRVIEEINRRWENAHSRVNRIFSADPNHVAELVNVFASEIGESIGDSVATMNTEDLKWWSYQQTEDRALELFQFSEDQLRQLAPAGYDPIPYLERCCWRFGDLHNFNFSELLNGNPIWSQPFVRVSNLYFLFVPFTVLSFPFHLLLSAIGQDLPNAKKRVEDVRGSYVEKECEALIRTYCPTATVFRGLYWEHQDGKRYETDLIALIGSRLLVFEAKGALLPDRIRSGNFIKAKSFLKDTYGVATTQASRLVNAIISIEKEALQLTDQTGTTVLSISKGDVASAVAYSVTIEQLGTLANARELFAATGVLGEDLFPAPPLMLSDFRQILEMLPDEMHRLHYLVRRHQLFSVIDIVGDEVDIFATYVMFGFTSLPVSRRTIVALGASFYLKDHLQNGHVVFPQSSSVSNTRYFERLLNYVFQRCPSDYWELAFCILDVPAQAQTQFEKTMKELRSRARQVKPGTLDVCAIPITGGPVSLVLCGSVYGERDRDERNNTLKYALMEQMEKARVSSGFLIGRQLGYVEYPYSIAIYFRRALSDKAAADHT